MMKKGEKREPLSPISAARVSSRTSVVKTSSSQTPGKSMKAENAGVSKSEIGYDRFIPRRPAMDNDVSFA